MNIDGEFLALTGHLPFVWQKQLYAKHFANGDIPGAVDVPTGLGKTSVMALWLIARARRKLPRRLVYVVDRRAVVDQATEEAERLRSALEGDAKHFETVPEPQRTSAREAASALKALLFKDSASGRKTLPISTLRGAYVDNREWLEDPSSPAIIVGTVDMIGSRLLFEGYGVSRKVRPYHAAFLGVDALVVLDEAHLVPPFEHLMRAIETDATLWPKHESDRSLLPRFRVLPLSATQRSAASAPFQFEDVDEPDPKAAQRLYAEKHLSLHDIDQRAPDKQLADAAWRLATQHGPKRVVVFCNRRDNDEEGAAATAQGVKTAIEKIARGDRRAGAPKVDIHGPELLVGARRVREREQGKRKLSELGFIGERTDATTPTFLIATAAGEVGVDIDADHMVSDLVAWERMVQRLGRVNRRGEGRAEVVAFDLSAIEKDEARKAQLAATRELLRTLEGDACPAALRALQTTAGREKIDAASTPEPLRPALSRALADAWSMTSLEEHTGRPEIAPWLRGWVEDERPQTTLVWRKYLPVREQVPHWPRSKRDQKEVEEFFEAAPPHESEKLETETFRIVDWLQARAHETLECVAGKARREYQEDGDAEPVIAEASNDSQNGAAAPRAKLGGRDIVAFALSRRGDFESYALEDLAQERDASEKKALIRDLSDRVVIVDARLGGLDDRGMLDENVSDAPKVADEEPNDWMLAGPGTDGPVIRFWVDEKKAIDRPNWRRRRSFLKRAAETPENEEWLHVFKWGADSSTADDLSIIRNQSLKAHSEDTRRYAERIGEALVLPPPWIEAVKLAAWLHDAGKARALWQSAMGKPKAPGDADWPYAKTDGKNVRLRLLKIGDDTFRHEFASVIVAQDNAELLMLDTDVQDLVLHLVAAHHGFARPVIFAHDPETAPSKSEEVARDVALRFARLQKRWGPWGLAWWEALVRAADQQASRALETTAEESR